jgi:N6-L-threonylcarbamoyladenine synthase
MNVLGIETSCDETGVAVYSEGRGIVAEALASQIELHQRFGGVVPELAARDHSLKLAPMVDAVVAGSGIELRALDAIAYTAGPGLIGALMVGGAYATSLAYALGVPAVPVHHMEGHLLAAMLEGGAPAFPFLALLVSGGHTQLVVAERVGRYRTIGHTLDDAAGEAFDKVARLLGLPYPGGPAIAALAESGDASTFGFPRPLRGRGLDFSFSGLKTAVRLAVEPLRGQDGLPSEADRANVAASFELAVVETLVAKCLSGLEDTGLQRLVVAGGVGANRNLRRTLAAAARERGAQVFYPRPSLCTDNGAMIAYAGFRRMRIPRVEPLQIVARPRWPLDELDAV